MSTDANAAMERGYRAKQRTKKKGHLHLTDDIWDAIGTEHKPSAIQDEIRLMKLDT